MTTNVGTLVVAPLAPYDSADTYPTHEDKYGKGGFTAVATVAERNAITSDRRKHGMRVYVQADGTEYTLGSDLTTWTARITDAQFNSAYTDVINAAAAADASATAAELAAEASGDVLFFDTYAAALAAIGTYPNNQVVEIFVDETKANRATRYRKEAGVLVFKIYMDQSPQVVTREEFNVLAGATQIVTTTTFDANSTVAVYFNGVRQHPQHLTLVPPNIIQFSATLVDMLALVEIGEALIGFSQAASDTTIIDAGGYFVGTNVEDALQEVGADLALPTAAADVSIVDAGTFYTAAHVEGALQEIGTSLASSTATLAAAVIGDNRVVRGDGGVRGVQSSGVTISDTNAISGYVGDLNLQTGTTYTILSTDTGKVIDHSNAAAITVTLPNSAPVGTCVTYVQTGAGQITFSPQVGATLVNRQSHTKAAGQYAVTVLYVRANTGSDATWVLGGDTAA